MEPAKSNLHHPDDLPANLPTQEAESLFEKEIEEDQNLIIREADSSDHTQSWWHMFSWRPTNDAKLKDAEKAMLSIVETPYEQFIVKVGEDSGINTIKMGQGPPLVLLHGFGGGVGIWLSNLDELAKKNTIYAIDVLGFGRSSRPQFIKDPTSPVDSAETFFIDSLHEWTRAMKLEKFNLLGHSMGGYISAIYALRHPEKLSHLILADPWGLPEMPPNWNSRLPLAIRVIARVVMSISSSPMTLLRAAGPVGPSLIAKLRPDLVAKFSQHFPQGSRAALDYIYHVNAQYPSGEEAFAALQLPGSFSWAAKPLVQRLPALDESVPITFMYGEHTWMDKWVGLDLKDRLGARAQYAILPDAGHHIYVDNPRDFNRGVQLALKNQLKQISDDQMEMALQKWRFKQQQMAPAAAASAEPSTN